jgi:pyrimidine-nucleoside phosphorylase
MRMIDLIHKKRDGDALTQEEIQFIIQGYTNGSIPDYQMSAWAMAIFFQGMTAEETAHLTMAMVESGDQIDLSSIEGTIVDKHSTGGVGDTTTLVLAPLVASCGVPVAKMSGRGLGHTGGTIDKLESFQGFSVELENQAFIELVNKNKLALVGQSGNLTPADKKLYALRDVTSTVDTIPLIASSIMSKKIASGADAIVLDVKVGSGAFMKSTENAKELAQAMVDIGTEVGRQTIAVISDMNQPLGLAIGNALEIKEAINTLQGKGPQDLEELCLTLGSHMLCLAKKAKDQTEAREILKEKISNGEALKKLRQFVQAQGGDPNQVLQPETLPQAKHQVEVLSPQAGFVQSIEAEDIGTLAMLVGAGRSTKEANIDLAVGIVLHKKVGDTVEKGDSLATLHLSSEQEQAVYEKKLVQAYTFSPTKPSPLPLIYDEILPETSEKN